MLLTPCSFPLEKGEGESYRLSNVAEPLRSQEALTQAKHGDHTRTIEIYQGTKLALTTLESAREFFFFLEYYATCNVQGMPVFKDKESPAPASITFRSLRGHNVSRRQGHT